MTKRIVGSESVRIYKKIKIKSKLNQSSEELLGKVVNFQEEILLIEKVSGQLKGIFRENETTYLKLLARYVGSRLNSDQENSKFRYADGFEEMMDSPLEIPEAYFNKESKNKVYFKGDLDHHYSKDEIPALMLPKTM